MKFIRLLVVVLGLLVAALLVVGSLHYYHNRKALVFTVNAQIDGHASSITSILTTMRGQETRLIEDTIFEELQRVYDDVFSSSIISRSNIKVTKTPNGFLQCTIDTSHVGITPRVIQSFPGQNQQKQAK